MLATAACTLRRAQAAVYLPTTVERLSLQRGATKVGVRPVPQSDLTFAGPPCATQERAHWPVSRLWAAMVTNYTLPGARLVSSTMKPTVATVARTSCGWTLAVLYARCCAEARAWTARWRPAQERTPTAARPTARIYTDSLILALAALTTQLLQAGLAGCPRRSCRGPHCP